MKLRATPRSTREVVEPARVEGEGRHIRVFMEDQHIDIAFVRPQMGGKGQRFSLQELQELISELNTTYKKIEETLNES